MYQLNMIFIMDQLKKETLSPPLLLLSLYLIDKGLAAFGISKGLHQINKKNGCNKTENCECEDIVRKVS